LKAIGAFGVLFLLFMAGFTISTSFWSSSNATLQNDLQHSQDELSKAIRELADLKSEYAAFRQRGITGNSRPGAGNQILPPSEGGTQAPTGQDYEMISVATEETSYGFRGEIFISLAAIAFEGEPLRHKVIATVGSPGLPSLTIDRKEVGFTTRFKAKDDFSIVVTEADTFSAQFLVTKIPK
jgi:hypothetical protein